jgi:hypothetical protein
MIDDPSPGSMGGYRSDRNQRSGAAQIVPAVALVLVLIGGVIGVSRFISDRRAGYAPVKLPNQQAAETATTAPAAKPQQAQPAPQAQPAQPNAAQDEQGGQQAQPQGQQQQGAGGGASGVPNLVKNPGFEGDLALTGWDSTDAILERVQPGKDSDWAVVVKPDPGAPPPAQGTIGDVVGISAASVVRAATGGSSVLATAWVKAVGAQTKARIVLVERFRGKVVGNDVITLPLYDTDWHAIAVSHRIRSGGSTIDIQVGQAGAAEGDGVVIDGVGTRVAQPSD